MKKRYKVEVGLFIGNVDDQAKADNILYWIQQAIQNSEDMKECTFEFFKINIDEIPVIEV